MYRYIKALLKTIFLSLFIFVFPQTISAQVLINEFSSGTSSDWIELYNTSTQSADLSTYKLTDSGTNDKTLSGNIEPGGFVSFSFSNWLNNATADAVKLFDGNTQIDSIYYGGLNQICFADENNSIGRFPDGGNTIDRFSSPTRNLSNNSSILNACPSLTPTPTSTPTPTPNPASAPTTASTTTPTKTSTPSPTKSPTPKPTRTPLPEVLAEGADSTPETIVLGVQTDSAVSPSPDSTDNKSRGSFPFIAVVFIGLGFLLIGLSGYFAFKKIRQPQSL